MKKRILSLVLAVCLALSLAPAAFAANIVDSGTCGADADGSNIAWTLDADGNLTVTGAGLLQKKAFQNRKDIVTVKFVCTDDHQHSRLRLCRLHESAVHRLWQPGRQKPACARV